MVAFICKGKGGFTLIEVLVGVLIVGLLAGLAAPRLKDVWDNAKQSACRANMKQIEAALEFYYVENNKYPQDLENLKAGTGEDKVRLKTIPTCPQSGDSYQYTLKGQPKKGYELECTEHGFYISETTVDFSGEEKGG
ncbi:MAG TPA: prepilin-type N-terminal cleavage/methylation domain-containing protein [bacterium]|nr:prepilin-type N-terminal cleavage/methylation domain-containing protein [bacterium]